jgi:hypothetical protein
MATKKITLNELRTLVKQIIKEERMINEGEQWVDGDWKSDNYETLIKKIEDIFLNNGRGASFSYNGKDFTIIKKGERFLVTSSTDFGYEALNIKGAIVAAHKFSTGAMPKTGFQK